MQIEKLTQGTPEWLAYRAQHFNASDAPAMMGCSPYKSRRQLIQELHTGIAPEVSAATQRRFNEGHRIEALALPLAEEIIKDDLYPVTGSTGKLSASFDGLTMCQTTAFEHKTLNDELRGCISESSDGSRLPLMYRVQMEQQLMVSGASSVLFMASKWDGDELLEELHCWYCADAELAARIEAGWAQFALDLATYEPTAPAPVIVATVMDSLPAVMVQTKGELSIVSNLPEFAFALRAFIAKIPAKPATDQEFADTENACKALKKAEDALEAAENNALAMGTVEEMRRMVADLRTLARVTRLASEKLVARQKDQMRLDIVQRGTADLSQHIASLNARLGKPYMPATTADFAGAIKGKRTIDSLNDAVDTLLANTKISASTTADRIQANLGILRELAAERYELFADAGQLVLKAPDDLTAIIKGRIADADKKEADRLESLREQIRQEEQAKLEAAAAVIRAEAEQQARAKLAADAAMARAAAPAPAPALPPVEPKPDVPPAPAVSNQADDAFIAARKVSVSEAEEMFPRQAPASVEPTLTLGEISTRTGLPLSAAFLRSMGFEPAGQRRAAILFHESDFERMLLAIEAHLRSVREAHHASA